MENFVITKCIDPDWRPGLMPRLLEIYEAARRYMRSTGNMEQWTGGYPSRETIMDDAAQGWLYLVECRDMQAPCSCKDAHDVAGGHTTDERRDVVGCFCLRPSPEPNYSFIENGRWLDEGPYHVIHRLASDGSVKGVGRAVFGWCMERCGNLRVDTHADNTTMLSLLDRLGFTRCGTIYVEDGTPRTAFQWHR